MIGLIQVVKYARVEVKGNNIGSINQGILALLGFEKTDSIETTHKMLNKILLYRIFPDANGKTNLSLKDINGGLLLVPQFTLVADTTGGLRPSFSAGMAPAEGKALFEYFLSHAKTNHSEVASGEFGAYMHVSLCNDGPMTFILKA